MLDTTAAYRPDPPRNPGDLPSVIVALDDDIEEMFVFGSWLEGKRTRFNLVQFKHGTISRVLRGWSGDLVMQG